MPPPLDALATIATAPPISSPREALYDLLRREQALSASEPPSRSEVFRILDFAQAAYGDLIGVLVGRDNDLLDGARDGDWTLRDVIRHAIAVELRYAAQIDYSATRAASDPVEIRLDLLPCDRLAPPEPEYAASRNADLIELLVFVGKARATTDARLRTVPDSALSQPSMWGKQLVDVRARLHQVAVHLAETTIQAEKIVGSGGELRAIVRRCCSTRGMHERWSSAEQRLQADAAYRAIRV